MNKRNLLVFVVIVVLSLAIMGCSITATVSYITPTPSVRQPTQAIIFGTVPNINQAVQVFKDKHPEQVLEANVGQMPSYQEVLTLLDANHEYYLYCESSDSGITSEEQSVSYQLALTRRCTNGLIVQLK